MKTIITFTALVITTTSLFAQWPASNNYIMSNQTIDNISIEAPSMESILLKEIAYEESQEFYSQLVTITPDLQYELLEANDGLYAENNFSKENFYAHMGDLHTDLPNDILLEQNPVIITSIELIHTSHLENDVAEFEIYEVIEPEMINVYEPEEEIVLGFDTEKYLPKNFNPQIGLTPKPAASLALTLR